MLRRFFFLFSWRKIEKMMKWHCGSRDRREREREFGEHKKDLALLTLFFLGVITFHLFQLMHFSVDVTHLKKNSKIVKNGMRISTKNEYIYTRTNNINIILDYVSIS